MASLVIAEHNNSGLREETAHALTAALLVDDNVDILVVGHGCRQAAEAAARLNGVCRVLIADAPMYEHQLAENAAVLIEGLMVDYGAVLTPSTTTGRNLLPRVAALLDVMQISDIISVVSPDTFKRSIYAGDIIETVQTIDDKKVITVRTTVFPAQGCDGNAPIVSVNNAENLALSSFCSEQITVSQRPDLSLARVVVSGGRGMGAKENFAMIEALADHLGAAIGASRAAVDAGYVSNDLQVGQTGKIVAPELYIAVGISGAIQHLAGMKDSKIIVAINKDEEAPIFEIADYGLVEDLFTALPEFSCALDVSLEETS